MLVDYKDFVAELSIAQLESPPVRADLNRIIEAREPEIMKDLFGSIYYEYIKAVASSNIASISVRNSDSLPAYYHFFVENALELSRFKEYYFGISSREYVFSYTLPYEAADRPNARDFIANSGIPNRQSSGPVYLVFDIYDPSGLIPGIVMIDSDYDVVTSDPVYWGVLDPNALTYEDLLAKCETDGLQISRYGIHFDENTGDTYLSQAVFNGQMIPFISKESFDEFLKMVKQIVACFVWYWYSRNNATLTTSAGQATPKTENAVTASPAGKQTKIWNQMHHLIFDHCYNSAPRKFAYYANFDMRDQRYLRHKYAVINELNF